MTSATYAARKHGLTARQLVAFIHNRHCSRVQFTDYVHVALHIAWTYGTEEAKIAADIETVASYGDLAQYARP